MVTEQTSRSMRQRESPEIDPHKYSQLIFGKGLKAVMNQSSSFSQMVMEQLDIHMKKIDLDTDLTAS